MLLALRETNEQTHKLGVEEQLLDTGQESGLVQAQVIPADLEARPLVFPGKLEAGQLLIPEELEAGTLVILVESEAEPWDAGIVSLLANVYGHLVDYRVVQY